MTSETSGERSTEEGLEGIPVAGDVIAGKFVVEGVLGAGGMGVVVSARHAQLGQKVAIKFLRKGAERSPEAVPRFLREARAVVALQSAHVVRVMDVGVLENGMPYMVMEHLVGTDLQRLLEERSKLPLSEAVDYLLQGMEAIAEAHAQGIVHRDLKPANLFLARTPDGSPLVKVLDFGISKASGVAKENLTATAAVIGTPHYMSPEQLRSSKNVDPRTDVWALGVILFELLVGRMPFDADTVPGVCAKIAADPPTPLRAIDPSLPAGLEAVVARCLEKDPARRLASVADLAVLLQPFASPAGKMAVERIVRIGGVGAVPISGGSFSPPSGSSGSPVSGQTDTAWHPTADPPSRRALTPMTVGIAALVVGAVVAAIALRTTHTEGPKAPAASAAPTLPSAPAVVAPVPSIAAMPPTAPPPPVPSASSVASSAPAASPPPKTPAAKRPPKRASSQPGDDDLMLERK